MKKLYLILDKRGNFESRGNSSKSAWRSLYWIHYHIVRYGNYGNLNEYRIMTLYSDGRNEIVSANQALSSLPSYKERINKEIERDLGVKCDINSLAELYKNGFIASHLTAAVTNTLTKYGRI
jgi:hypothetical protein